MGVIHAAHALYVGDELIPRAVEVDMLSSDNALNEHVIVYNAAKGFEIDYSGRGGTRQIDVPAAIATPEPVAAPEVAADGTVYVSPSGKKYHRDPNCRGLRNAKSLEEISQEEALSRGKEPCSICG